MLLPNNHEIVATLKEVVMREDNGICLVFNIDLEIDLPLGATETDNLEGFIGKQVGVIHVGCGNAGHGIYRIRQISPSFKDGKIKIK